MSEKTAVRTREKCGLNYFSLNYEENEVGRIFLEEVNVQRKKIMIVLSDCLTNKIDEGCLKVANSLTKRLKKADASTMVISFERKPDYSDIHMSLNKFF